MLNMSEENIYIFQLFYMYMNLLSDCLSDKQSSLTEINVLLYTKI